MHIHYEGRISFNLREIIINLLKSISSLRYSIALALVMALLFIAFSPRLWAQADSSMGGDSQFSHPISQQRGRVSDLSLLSSRSPSRFQGDWRLELGLFSFEEDTDDSKSVRAGLATRSEYVLTKNLKLKGDFKFNTESGRTQTRFEQGTDRFLFVNNATVEFRPLNFLVLEGGILNQSYLGQELLFSSQRAFAGAKGGLVFDTSPIKAQVFVQQSLPSSVSLNTERAEKEELPLFTSQSLSLSYENEALKAEFGGLLFQYDHLPSKVAFQSAITGNTIVGHEPANSLFQYEFSGYALGSKVDVRITDNFTLLGSLQILENTNADVGNRRGQIAWVGPVVNLGDLKVAFNYGQFFAEPDAVPSYYMSLLYGGTNRQGQFGRLELEFTNHNFRLIGQYVESDTINDRVHQFSRVNYLVRLETLYVSF